MYNFDPFPKGISPRCRPEHRISGTNPLITFFLFVVLPFCNIGFAVASNSIKTKTNTTTKWYKTEKPNMNRFWMPPTRT
jgi:hypothetical protein